MARKAARKVRQRTLGMVDVGPAFGCWLGKDSGTWDAGLEPQYQRGVLGSYCLSSQWKVPESRMDPLCPKHSVTIARAEIRGRSKFLEMAPGLCG